MKKLFISALALAAFTACSQEEIVDNQQLSAAISFDGVFVENATRVADPSTTTDNIAAFDVWGYVKNSDGVVFDDVTVNKKDGKWTYEPYPLQYWIPGNDYRFFALSPSKTGSVVKAGSNDPFANGLGQITYTNNNGTEDLLYASVSRENVKSAEENVKFIFDHLLSKVKFTFLNGFTTGKNTISVTNVKMVVPQTASIDLNKQGNYAWTGHEGTVTLEFDDMSDGTAIDEKENGEAGVSDYERLTIPAAATQEYTVTFDVELFQNGVSVLTGSKEVKINGCELKPGYAYNFKATLDQTNIVDGGLNPIVFEAEVAGWVEEEYDGGVITTKEIGVKSVEEFEAAIAAGVTNFKLTNDIKGSLIFGDKADGRSVDGKEYVLDLNGMTIENNTDSGDYGTSEAIVAYSNLTINGEGTVIGNTRAVWARGNDDVVVTINGGTYKGAKEGFANGGCSVIYASGGNTINIYGGTFEALSADLSSYADKTNGVYAALNVYDNDGTINVYGGSFFKQNPAAPGTEPAAWNAAHANGFVADGYTAVKIGDWYTIGAAVSTAAELQAAINAGGYVTLASDIQLEKALVITGSSVVNLNGKTLTAGLFAESNGAMTTGETDSYVFWVKEGGNLEINGKGKVLTQACKYSIAVWAQGGDVTINDGYFENAGNGSDLIYASAAGNVIINGGEFKACKKIAGEEGTAEEYSVLNLKGNSGSSITCYGGKYHYFNPENNKSENPKVNFCADGYKAQGYGNQNPGHTYFYDYYMVVKK